MNILQKIYSIEKCNGKLAKDIYEKMGVSRPTFFYVKNNRQKPTDLTLAKIVNYAIDMGIEITLQEARVSFEKGE